MNIKSSAALFRCLKNYMFYTNCIVLGRHKLKSYGSSLLVGCSWCTTLGWRWWAATAAAATAEEWWWWWWCSGRRDRPNKGGSKGKGSGGKWKPAAKPPNKAEAVECSWALRLNSARLLLRCRSLNTKLLLLELLLLLLVLPVLVVVQQPHRLPAQLAQLAGDQDNISWRLLLAVLLVTPKARWFVSTVLQSEGAAEANVLDELTCSFAPNSGGENCAAKWGEKNRDVAVVSTGRKPLVLVDKLQLQSVCLFVNFFFI